MLIELDAKKKKTLLKALASGSIEVETLDEWLCEATEGHYISPMRIRRMSDDELMDTIERLEKNLEKSQT